MEAGSVAELVVELVAERTAGVAPRKLSSFTAAGCTVNGELLRAVVLRAGSTARASVTLQRSRQRLLGVGR